jgi:hypothetical protein
MKVTGSTFHTSNASPHGAVQLVGSLSYKKAGQNKLLLSHSAKEFRSSFFNTLACKHA